MKDVYVLVLPGVMLLDLAGISDTFRIAIQFGAAYRVHHIGPSASASSSVGLSISGTEPCPKVLPAGSMVVVPGFSNAAVEYKSDESRMAIKWLGETITDDHRLCTVCSGVFVAAKAGLLDSKTVTTHHLLTARLAKDFPAITVLSNQIYVQDGGVFTSAGATTGVDLMLKLVSIDESPEMALAVARKLVVYFRRSGADPQLSTWLVHRNHIHTAIHRAQDAVIKSPASDWTLPDLAKVACTSPRHLTRLFQTHLGISPLTYVRQVRTAAAKEIVESSRQSVEAVANIVGFSSAAQMRRAWQQFKGGSPTEGRRLTGLSTKGVFD